MTDPQQARIAPTIRALLPAYQDPSVTVYANDCLAVLRELPNESIHSVVTDPPYAIEFEPLDLTPYVGTSTSCEKCGANNNNEGHRICVHCVHAMEITALMGSPMLGMQSQNWHEKATHSRGYAANDNQQFQQWCHLWLTECFRVLKPGGHLIAFGGTRTWHRLAVATEDAGFEIRDSLAWLFGTGFPKGLDAETAIAKLIGADSTAGSSPTAAQWAGWNTTLKPSHEPIVLARKPLDGTVPENLLKHGTGALNIKGLMRRDHQSSTTAQGRWQGNVMLDSDQATHLDLLAGGPASRFFWVAKPTGSERVRIDGVAHPTVKPLDLMRALAALVTRPGQTLIDPFTGSGTTIEACILERIDVIGIEREALYLPLIRHRIARRRDPLTAGRTLESDCTPDLFQSADETT